MGIDAVDTAKSTFGSLNTETGLKVISLLFVIQLANLLGTMMFQSGSTMAALGGLLTVLAAVASVLVTLGALRSFDSGSFEKGHYTENLLWPIGRLAGVNVTTTLFAYGIGVVAALPAVVATALTGTSLSGGLSGASITMALLVILGMALGVAAFIYVFLTLIVSVPMVAADDRRMFESLDLSVQRTSGQTTSMLFAALPLIALYLVSMAFMAAATPSQGTTINPALGAVSSLLSSVVAATFFSLVTEYNQRLPEA